MRFEVHPESDFRRLSFYVRTATREDRSIAALTRRVDVLAPVCEAPCSAVVRSRTYDLAVGAQGRTPVAATKPVKLRGGEILTANYQSRTAMRVAGWVVLLGGVVGGSFLVSDALRADGSTDTGELVAGSVITGVSLIGGLIMANQPDRVRLTLH